MNKKIFKYELGCFISVSILGTIWHFLYEWLGYSNIIGAVSPVNESPWEHLKILWFPFLILSVIEYFLLKRPNNFWFSKAVGGIGGLIGITIFYYTYSGIIGKNVMPMDILAFVFGVALAHLVSKTLICSDFKHSLIRENISIAICIFICILFIMFTFMPPLIPWFKDMQHGTYGL